MNISRDHDFFLLSIVDSNTCDKIIFMPFYHIRSREQAKYEAVIHCSVLV